MQLLTTRVKNLFIKYYKKKTNGDFRCMFKKNHKYLRFSVD